MEELIEQYNAIMHLIDVFKEIEENLNHYLIKAPDEELEKMLREGLAYDVYSYIRNVFFQYNINEAEAIIGRNVPNLDSIKSCIDILEHHAQTILDIIHKTR